MHQQDKTMHILYVVTVIHWEEFWKFDNEIHRDTSQLYLIQLTKVKGLIEMVLVAERIPKDLSIKDKSYNVLLCYH